MSQIDVLRLHASQIAAINPNTKTAPVFRSRADADLTAKIYCARTCTD